jgi:hypothetical protein
MVQIGKLDKRIKKMITYKTEIISMTTVTEPTPNYVTSVNFKVTGTTDSKPPIVLSFDNSVNFNIDSTQTEFEPYSKLTEEEVLSWIDPTLIGSMQMSIKGQIDSILNPPVIPEETPLPWENN